MRIDKYLKVSRIIKRRTVANEACDAGRVIVNGKPVKASYDVKINDVIEIQFGQRTVKVQVLNLNETVKKEAANNATSNSKFKEYEKYYETILPQLATALEFTTEGLVVKTFLALSGVCTIIAAFFLLFLV